MNKLILTLSLLALVGCAFAQNDVSIDDVLDNMSFVELGEEEASSAGGDADQLPSGLTKEQVYFRDFCIKAQDEISTFIREKLNNAASDVYTILLTSASEVGDEVLHAQRDAVAEGTKVIEQSLPVENKSEDISENVETALDNMSTPSLFSRLNAAVKMVIGAIVDAARTVVFRRLTELKEQIGRDNLKFKISEACSAVSDELQPRLEGKLKEAKSQLNQELSGQDQLLASLNSMNTNKVGCALSGRVYKVAKFCDILKVAGPAIYTLVGID